MGWTPATVIGHNVKARREALNMTAKTLGVEIGAAVGKEGKAWPPQAVYMMEAGDRAMNAAEVVALGEILGLRVVDLFAPPSGVEEVAAGTLRVPADRLAAPVAADADVEALAVMFESVDEVRRRLYGNVRHLWHILDDARAAMRGEELPSRPTGDGLLEWTVGADMDDVDSLYATVRERQGRRSVKSFDAFIESDGASEERAAPGDSRGPLRTDIVRDDMAEAPVEPRTEGR